MIECLYVYLATGRNVVETSKRLYMHRNTFIYKLGKITDIIGKETFESDDSILEMMLSCKIIMMMQEKNSNNRQIMLLHDD